MISKRTILAALVAGLGIATANAYANAPMATPAAAFTIAKHGADDPADPCDDHGTNLCRIVAQHGADNPVEPELELLGQHGADNPVEPEVELLGQHGADDGIVDDNGVDFVVAQHGADNPVEPEIELLGKNGADDGVDGPDDNGTDIVA